MAKDRSEKKERKEKKEKKRSEVDGVKKAKKEKKEPKVLSEPARHELTDKLLADLEKPAAPTPADDGAADAMVVDAAEEVTTTMTTAATTGEKEARPVGALVPFAHPLVEDKPAKKVLKSVKKATANKALKRGVKEVVKALRKAPVPAPNAKNSAPVGVVVLAADISPMDVISHIPVLCEDHGIPYVFVTSRAELGSAGATKRPTSVVMVLPRAAGKKDKEDKEKEAEYAKVYEELLKVVEKETKRIKI
ncbi:snoRNA-binding protein [Ascosphaera acerosa]|nr:snoRNA-binding protein [Ascosphaera acerosa]